jgi:hypothetical protein
VRACTDYEIRVGFHRILTRQAAGRILGNASGNDCPGNQYNGDCEQRRTDIQQPYASGKQILDVRRSGGASFIRPSRIFYSHHFAHLFFKVYFFIANTANIVACFQGYF